MTSLPEAVDAYLADARARNVRPGTLKRYEVPLRQLCAFADARATTALADVDRALLREWRESRQCQPSTQATDLQITKSFFRFAHRERWVEEDRIKGLRPPRPDSPPTMPLTEEEMARLVAAFPAGSRERALILLMRYSGLAILDAVTLPRTALDGQLLTLRRAKSGELVICELPALVADELEAVTPRRRHYFWNGESKRETATGYWRARMARGASLAEIDKFRPHRLRDTFAVALLLADVAMEDVAALLGHSSVATTEKHYAPWDPARRKRLVRVVRRAHRSCRLLARLAAQAQPTEQGDAAAVLQNSRRRRPSNPIPNLGDVA